MYSLKEKVTEKISSLLADSPSSPLEPPEVISRYKGRNTLSSIFSFALPSASSNGKSSDKSQGILRPIQSPARYTSLQDESLSCHSEQSPRGDKNGHNPREENEASHSKRPINSSEMFEDAVKPQNKLKLMPNLTEESTFISPDLYEFLESSLPNIVRGCQWVLLYSTLKHGISLRTLIRKSADLNGPCLLITGDVKGAIFGGLLDGPLRPSAKRKYQGSIQTFVFTTIYGQPRIFRPTGVNRYYYMCLNDLLAFGGGGNFALSMEEDLLNGSSGPCETFGNECLAKDSDFELKNVELWGYTHLSRYV
ncbi:hypothetical protein V2J09_005636 [Rumex salicifolius]